MWLMPINFNKRKGSPSLGLVDRVTGKEIEILFSFQPGLSVSGKDR